MEKDRINYLKASEFNEYKERIFSFVSNEQEKRREFWKNNNGMLYISDVTDIMNCCDHLNIEAGYRLCCISLLGSNGPVGYLGALSCSDMAKAAGMYTGAYLNRANLYSFVENELDLIYPFNVIRDDDTCRYPFIEAFSLKKAFDALPRLADRYKYTIIESEPEFNEEDWVIYNQLKDYRPSIIIEGSGILRNETTYKLRICSLNEIVKSLHSFETDTFLFISEYMIHGSYSYCLFCDECTEKPYTGKIVGGKDRDFSCICPVKNSELLLARTFRPNKSDIQFFGVY